MKYPVQEIIKQYADKQLVDLTILPVGCKVEVHTKNSVYWLTKHKDCPREMLIQGGKFFPEETVGYINGTTYGGSMLKLNCITLDAFLEMYAPSINDVITTTRIAKIIVHGNNWNYDLSKS